MADYKKKYSSIQSSKDMSTAVKRHSLQGKPLSERLVLGGTLQVSKDPTSLDLSPLLGYRLNKKYLLGVGVTYRAILDFSEVVPNNQVYGFRTFAQRQVFKGFFLHGEYEHMNIAVDPGTPTDEFPRQWRPGALLGFGKEYDFVKNIKGQVMVLYNFSHEEGVSPYQKPVVVRFGFLL